MLLIAFSSLILVAKGSMHKANKRQDNWHAQVPLFNINQAGSKYELSTEVALLQFNSLKIFAKINFTQQDGKTGWGSASRMSRGAEATLSPSTSAPHTSVRKLVAGRSRRNRNWAEPSCFETANVHGDRAICSSA